MIVQSAGVPAGTLSTPNPRPLDLNLMIQRDLRSASECHSTPTPLAILNIGGDHFVMLRTFVMLRNEASLSTVRTWTFLRLSHVLSNRCTV